jgi:hypothetical protein
MVPSRDAFAPAVAKRFTGRDQRWPEAGALAGAGARAVLVLLEQIEGAAAPSTRIRPSPVLATATLGAALAA